MKSTILFGMLLGVVAGCDRGKPRPTRFFARHDGNLELKKLAFDAGLKVMGGGKGRSDLEKTFSVSIIGDDKDLRSLVAGYRKIVQRALSSTGMTINGKGNWSGGMRGFDFNYHRRGVKGIIRVNAMRNANGYIHVDVFMYEHEEY